MRSRTESGPPLDDLPRGGESVEDLAAVDARLRAEADGILDGQGLRGILSDYGRVHAQGSYGLRVMTWRDLDVYLEADDLSVERFFELGGRAAERLQPVRMVFRNNRLAAEPNLPDGLYWGAHLGGPGRRGWKIDLWAMDAATCEKHLAYSRTLAAALTDDARGRILRIKAACWRHPLHRKQFTSVDIYRAVLEAGAAGLCDFQAHLRQTGRDIAL